MTQWYALQVSFNAKSGAKFSSQKTKEIQKKWFFNHANSKNCKSRMWKLKLYPRGKGEGALAVYMTGVWSYDRASYCEPKNYFNLKITPQKITGIKIYGYPQNYELNTSILIYSIKQTFLTHDFASIRLWNWYVR